LNATRGGIVIAIVAALFQMIQRRATNGLAGSMP
jgi:hypothetical protein